LLNCHEKTDPTIEKINTAVEILRHDVVGKISPEEVASRIGISYSLFRRIFKENMGTSPAQYQMDIRLKKAQELLKLPAMDGAKEKLDEVRNGFAEFFTVQIP
jgi:transcriptional regulator GlxA family with amidase domain